VLDSRFTVTITPNGPPVFTTAIIASHLVVKPQTTAAWNYTLPTIVDSEGDSVTLSVNLGNATFVKFTSSNISFDIADISAAEVLIGTYDIAVRLSDATGSSLYTMTLKVSDPCLERGIVPIAIPKMTAQVGVSTAKFEFSPSTECG